MRAWRCGLPDTGLVSGYLLAVRLDRWELDHPGWVAEWRADFCYWEALRRRPAEVVSVCRATVDELFARVDEFLAGEQQA